MRNKPFDPTKPVRTRDGRAARIVCTDAKSDRGYSILALVEFRGSEQSRFYLTDGSYFSSGENECDLINVEPTVKARFWVTFYPGGGFACTRDEGIAANDRVLPAALAQVVYDVDVAEGYGLKS